MESFENVLEQARQAVGLSQTALAQRAGTSRSTLSAYEQGRKSPTLRTATRIVAAAGFDLGITPQVDFLAIETERGRLIHVPDVLPRLPLDRAFATVELPLHLNWSNPDYRYDLRKRSQRARVYEIVLREGQARDILSYIDGALLVDLWDDLVLPQEVRTAWNSVVMGSTGTAMSDAAT